MRRLLNWLARLIRRRPRPRERAPRPDGPPAACGGCVDCGHPLECHHGAEGGCLALGCRCPGWAPAPCCTPAEPAGGPPAPGRLLAGRCAQLRRGRVGYRAVGVPHPVFPGVVLPMLCLVIDDDESPRLQVFQLTTREKSFLWRGHS